MREEGGLFEGSVVEDVWLSAASFFSGVGRSAVVGNAIHRQMAKFICGV